MKSSTPPHLLSMVVPAYRLSRTIIKDIRTIQVALSQLRYPYEIIIVIDGKDDPTYKKVQTLRSTHIRVLALKHHSGKGAAVRYGMSRAKGDYIGFIDAGMEIDPNGISMLLEHLEWYQAEVIIGSKRHPVSVIQYPRSRRLLSWGYQWLIRVLFRLNIKDSQPGLKIYTQPVLEKVLPAMVVKKYAFDIEMLAVANHFGFKRIFEAPIKIEHPFGNLSNAATIKEIWHTLYDTSAVFYRLRIKRHYDQFK